jgi:hypothetical protein
MLRRIARTLALLTAGLIGGFVAAAAVMRGWLPSRGDATSDELALVTIFDGIQLASTSTAFRGGSILAWFGGVELDLTGVTLAPDARLDVRALFGGVMVKVPADWRISAESQAFLGGVDAPQPDSGDPDAPMLTIRATCAMGGVAVSH